MKKILTLIIACTLGIAAMAQEKSDWKKPAEMYIYGFASSLSDSTAYATAVLPLEGCSIKKGNGFLYARNEYSYQLRDYLEQMGFKNPVVAVCFNKNKQKLEKKFMKMMSKNIKSGILLKHLSKEEFNFVGVEYVAPEYVSDETAPVVEKKSKKTAKGKKAKKQK